MCVRVQWCQAACCGLDAFEVNAFSDLRWIHQNSDDAAVEVLNQLDAMIVAVAANVGTVRSADDFHQEWKRGSDCATYLATWRNALADALMYSRDPDAMPSPEDRIAASRARGELAFAEVQRILTSAIDFM